MADEWLLIQLDENVARKHGLPAKVPTPKSEFEGIADAGFAIPKLKKWIMSFLSAAPPAWRGQNADLAKSYDRFIAKADFWERGLTALQKHDVAGAISAFKMIANVDPDDHAAKMNLGLAYAQSGDSEQAKKAFAAVSATYTGDPEYHVAFGQTLISTGDKDGAADQFALALEAQPDHMAALKALAALGILVAIYENPKDAASLTYLRADALASTMKEIWDEAGRDARYYVDQLEYHASENRHEIALAAAERAIEANDPSTIERTETARITALRSLGRLDEARGHADRVIAAHGDWLLARVERARVHFAAGREADANADLDAVLAADPGMLDALAIRYPLERTLSDGSAERLGAMKKWTLGHDGAARAHLWLGLLQARAGAQDDALASLARAVELAPADDAIRSAYWTELGRANKWDAVVADASKLDIKSRDWKVRWNEAEAYAALGKQVEARAAYTAINADESLPIDIRKRAKRAVDRLGSG